MAGSGAPAASRRQRPASLDLTAIALAACGVLSQFTVKMIGEIPIGEPLFLAVALIVLLLRGVGPRFSASLFWMQLATGLLMIFGYVLADLLAATGPEQYLRGWARVAMFVLDCLAVQVVVSHGYRNLGWFVFGLALATMGNYLVVLKPLNPDSWKTGYGIATGLLVALFSGRLPRLLAGSALIGFGLLSALLDFRSLGGVFVVAGVVLLYKTQRGAGRSLPILRLAIVAAVAVVAGSLLAWTLDEGQSDARQRRAESNVGRWIGIVVATRAIVDSPIVGYGSWANDKRYLQVMRQESVRASAKTKRYVAFGDNLLPHSQLLQAWVEGGVLAAAFFIAYAVAIARSFFWLLTGHAASALTPLSVILLMLGAWNLAASPFLGTHRIFIMLVVGVIALLQAERQSVPPARRRSGPVPVPVGAGHRPYRLPP